MTTCTEKSPCEDLREYLAPRLNDPEKIEVENNEFRVNRFIVRYVPGEGEGPYWRFVFPVVFPWDAYRKPRCETYETHSCDEKNNGLPHKNTLASIVKYLNWYTNQKA